ncbi:flippase [bacterium]|nr:flippase [bacterium]MBT4597939.1 flippase [bacterium]MBT7037206.1 flippase [bacterium]MBT7431607.1 flippase [bacterium]MBT7993063.1 flippase [bacterium]
MSVSRKIIYNVTASSISKVITTVIALVNIGLITRYLGQEMFGNYVVALAFFLLFTALGDFGIYQTTTREISRPGAKEDEIVNNAIGLRITISLAVIAISPIFIWLSSYSNELKIALGIVLFAFFFASFTQLLIGLFQKRLLMDRVALVEMFGKVLQLALVAIGVKMDLGFNFIVGTLLVTMFFNFIVIFWLAKKFVRFKPSFDIAYWKKFLYQSFPIGLSVFVSFIYFKADSIILSWLKPSADVGLYGAAYKVIENLSFFPGMIVGLTMPIISYNIFSNRKKFETIVNKNFKIFLILVIPILIGTQVLAEDIINLIAGSEFASSANILRIVIISLVFIFFGQLFNSILIAAKLQKKLLWGLLFCAVLNVSLNFLFIPKFSYLATAYISVLTEFFVVLIGGVLIYKNLKFFPKFERFPSIILSGIILWIFLETTKNSLSFATIVILSPIVYFTATIILKAISREEIVLLLKKDHREKAKK